jgi:hypothetical protein
MLMAVLWFLGYLTAGTRLGTAIFSWANRSDERDHPYLAAVTGLIILQIIGFIPFVGGVVTFVAGIVGGGALVLLAWRGWRGAGTAAEEPSAQVIESAPVS